MKPHIECITDFAGLLKHEEELVQFWLTSDKGTLFNHPAWLAIWWRVYAPSHSWNLYFMIVRQDNKIVGYIPTYIEHTKKWGQSFRRLRSMGDRYVGPSNITFPTNTSQMLLVSEYINLMKIDEILLAPITGSQTDNFTSKRSGSYKSSSTSMHINLPATSTQLWSSFSYNKRKELRTQRKRAERLGDIQFQETSIAEGIEALATLNRLRFAEKNIDGGFLDEKFSSFHQAITTEDLAGVAPKIFTLRLEGKIIAAASLFAISDTWHAYQGGFDPEWSSIGPGNLLDLFCLEEAIAQGVKNFDFGQGDQAYKKRFGAQPQLSYQFQAALTFKAKVGRAIQQIRAH